LHKTGEVVRVHNELNDGVDRGSGKHGFSTRLVGNGQSYFCFRQFFLQKVVITV
jgi:hypothetical protein